MPIVPDDKDWTWVLERPCPECGFDAGAVAPESVASRLRDNAAAWQRVLGQPDDILRRRPSDDRWSALEYACHVRDVCALYHERLLLMLRQDDPLYPNWDQDVTAVAARYSEQDPPVVSTELGAAAASLADGFDGVQGEQWLRPGRRGDGARFTIAGFSLYLLHDPVHHLYDVTSHRGC
jgi:DinB superfamily